MGIERENKRQLRRQQRLARGYPNAIAEARFYEAALAEPGATYRTVARRLGVTREEICQYMVVLKRLPPEMTAAIEHERDPLRLRQFSFLPQVAPDDGEGTRQRRSVKIGYVLRMARLRMARLLFLFAVGCHAASPGPAARCDVAGDWSANLMIYDGTAHLTVRDRDVLELELVGKGRQDRNGRRLDARHLAFDFPSGEVRCEISSDCKRIVCDAADGHRLFELSR